MEWIRCISKGKVQHVYYRKFVSDAMRKAGFKGYIRNLNDGTVETVLFVYDMQEELPQIKRILQEGSPMSEVEAIECDVIDGVDFVGDGFEIRY